MENQAPTAAPATAAVGSRKESSIDPVKAQGILTEVSRKTKFAARVWPEKWGFYTRKPEMQEEEAVHLGMSLKEYRAAVKSVNCQLLPKKYPVDVDPSPHPMPPTSSGMIGRRATCPLERYGRLVRSECDYPTRPPPPPGPYDPYKQTMLFLGSVEGDPISYKLPPARSEVSEEQLARPVQLAAAQLCRENLERAFAR